MPIGRIKQPMPIQGVSQQPPEIRQPAALESQLNGWSSPVEGLTKRPNTDHLARISDVRYRNALMHTIERDSREEYVTLFSHQEVRAFDTTGAAVPVFDFSNNAVDEDITLDSGWTLGDELNMMIQSGAIEDPEGLQRSTRVGGGDSQDNYVIYEMDTTGFSDAGSYVCRLRLKNDASLPSTETTIIRIQYDDTTPGANDHFLVYNPVDNTVGVDEGVDPGTQNLISFDRVDLGNGWWDVRFRFTYSRANETTTGKLYLKIQVDTNQDFATTSGGGFMILWQPEVFEVSGASYPYLNLEDSTNPIESPLDFSTGWTLLGNAIPAVSGPTGGPFGYGEWARLTSDAGAAPTGTYRQTVGEVYDGPQVLSVVFKDEGISTDTVSVGLGLMQNANPNNFGGAFFNFTADENGDINVLELDTLAGDAKGGGVIDLGGGAYQAWLLFDPDASGAIDPGDVRDIQVVVNEGDVFAQKTVLAWGVRLEDGVAEPTPYVDPVLQVSPVTIGDTTYVSSSNKVPDMGTTVTPEFTDDTEAFVFVRQGSYDTFYRVKFDIFDSEYIAELETLTGAVNTSGNPEEPRGVTSVSLDSGILTGETLDLQINGVPGAPGLSVTGFVTGQALIQQMYIIYDACQEIIQTNNLDVSVSIFNNTLRLTALDIGQNVAVAKSGTAASRLTVTTEVDAVGGDTRHLSISTDSIAAELAAQMNEFVDGAAQQVMEATTNGSVIRVNLLQGRRISKMEVEDGNGDANMLRLWKSVSFFDELPLTCRDGFKLRIDGNADQAEDDYYVEFVADDPGEFSKGFWQETVSGGMPFEFDASTMPHRLVRKQDDASGTISGIENGLYFEWLTVPWGARQSGDPITNPRPSFIGEPIRGMFFWKSRLGLLAGQNAVLSETGSFTEINFWRPSVRQVVDTDPIDISSGHTYVSFLTDVAPLEDNLLIFSDRSIFDLDGTPLSPRTASLDPTAEFRNIRRAQPKSVGRTVLFAHKRTDFSLVREIYRIDTDNVDAADITAAVSKYIPGEIQTIAVSSDHDCAVFTTDGDRSKLYVHKFTWEGQSKVQNSWSEWSFGDGQIVGADFIDEKLFLVLEREDGQYLESMELGDGLVDIGQDYKILLDRRTDSEDPLLTHNWSSPNTTITLPYDMELREKYEVVRKSDGVILSEGGQGFRNRLTSTECFDAVGGPWSTSGSGLVTTGQPDDPLGESNAVLVDDQDGANQYSLISTTLDNLVAGEYYTLSCYVKQSTASKVGIYLQNLTQGILSFNEFDFATSESTLVEAGGSQNTSIRTSDVGNGWFRLEVSVQHDSASSTLRVGLVPDRESNESQNATFFWGAQFEVGKRASEYERIRGYGVQPAPNEADLVVPMDITGEQYWVGNSYSFATELSKPVPRRSGQLGGLDFVSPGRLQLRRALVTLDNTQTMTGVARHADGRFDSRSTREFSTPTPFEFSVPCFGDANDTSLTLENNSPYPSAILGTEWQINWRPRGSRVG